MEGQEAAAEPAAPNQGQPAAPAGDVAAPPPVPKRTPKPPGRAGGKPPGRGGARAPNPGRPPELPAPSGVDPNGPKYDENGKRIWPEPSTEEVAGASMLLFGAFATLGATVGPEWATAPAPQPGDPTAVRALETADFEPVARALCQVFPGFLDDPRTFLAVWGLGFGGPRLITSINRRKERAKVEAERAAKAGA